MDSGIKWSTEGNESGYAEILFSADKLKLTVNGKTPSNGGEIIISANLNGIDSSPLILTVSDYYTIHSQEDLENILNSMGENETDIKIKGDNFFSDSFTYKDLEKELEKYGLYADLVPQVYDGAHLGRELAERCRPGEKVLIPRAAMGTRELTQALEAEKGIEIFDIPLYDTFYGEEPSGETGYHPDLPGILEKGDADYVVFTSASTVKGFAAAAGNADLRAVKAICIGAQTRAAAEACKMQTWTAKKATIDSLIEKLIEVHKKRDVLDIAGK